MRKYKFSIDMDLNRGDGDLYPCRVIPVTCIGTYYPAMPATRWPHGDPGDPPTDSEFEIENCFTPEGTEIELTEQEYDIAVKKADDKYFAYMDKAYKQMAEDLRHGKKRVSKGVARSVPSVRAHRK